MAMLDVRRACDARTAAASAITASLMPT